MDAENKPTTRKDKRQILADIGKDPLKMAIAVRSIQAFNAMMGQMETDKENNDVKAYQSSILELDHFTVKMVIDRKEPQIELVKG